MEPARELARFGVEVSSPVWRVSLSKYEPLVAPPAAAQLHGRFDDPTEAEGGGAESFSVLYCASTAPACFIETLSGLRIKLGVVEELLSNTLIALEERNEDSASIDDQGIVTKDWQTANVLTSGRIVTTASLFDLTNATAVQTLRFHLAPSLIALGLDDLDFAQLLGTNRDLTQAISRWIWSMTTDSGEPLFSGIRYRSRFDPEAICLALYENRYSVDGELDIQSITLDTPGFAEAASTLRLRIA